MTTIRLTMAQALVRFLGAQRAESGAPLFAGVWAIFGHGNVARLPVLLLPGDVFANRRPDPVLQQVEDFADGTVSANDCFRPVSRYFDRITRPEQILSALPRALSVLTDPAECGPVTLCMCQDVQAEAYDYPEAFFQRHVWHQRR